MKKNITINLFGSLYSIDEDACDLLEKYLDNTKRYFSKRDGGEEIADDIEHRVAELFEDLRSRGTEAIDIENVQVIIKRIGNPEDMDAGNDSESYSECESSDAASEKEGYGRYFGGRKLYRNPDNQIVGGVLSGLCTYFGGNDPLIWRILFVLLAIFTKIIPFCIIYIILWAIMPMAVTSEDKLKMKGKPVNMNTLNEEIMAEQSDTAQGRMMGIFNTLVTIIGFCLKLFFGFLICAGLLTMLVIMFGLITGFITPFSLTGYNIDDAAFISSYLEANPSVTVYSWISVLSAVMFLSILLYSIIHSIVKKNSGEKMSAVTRLILIASTILSLCSGIGFAVATDRVISKGSEEFEHIENTVNGVYLSSGQHQKLAENGWEIMCYENGSESVYDSMESFYDNDNWDSYLRFRRLDSRKPMLLNFRRSEYFPAGNYHIEAIAAATCNGAFLYAKHDDNVICTAEIPVNDGNGKGNIEEMDDDDLRNTAFFNISDSNKIWSSYDFHYKISFWNFVRSKSFHHEGGPLNYGITNIGTVVGMDDLSSPAWNFSLRRIKIVEDK